MQINDEYATFEGKIGAVYHHHLLLFFFIKNKKYFFYVARSEHSLTPQ